MGTDYTRLLSALRAPPRPQLVEAQAAIGKLVDAGEAWELLAANGVVPFSWIDASARGFVEPEPQDCEHCEGSGMTNAGWSLCYACSAGTVFPIELSLEQTHTRPPGLALCLALASMSKAVTTAEVLAREFAAQLVDLAYEPPLHAERSLRWRLGDGEELKRKDGERTALEDRESTHSNNPTFNQALFAQIPAEFNTAWGSLDLVRRCARRTVMAHASWEARAARKERIRNERSKHHGKLLAELSNPFAAALEVCSLGLAIEDVINGVIVLVMPPVVRR